MLVFVCAHVRVKELRRPFILGTAEKRWKPTLAHYFIRVCEDKGLLTKVFSQNIDGITRHTGVPKEKILNVHGSIGDIQCEFCDSEYPADEFRKQVKEKIRDIYEKDKDAPKKSQNILCKKCGKAGVKPATVLYGGKMPDGFFKSFPLMKKLDLLIIAGSSLTVSPANTIPAYTNESCVRAVLNLEKVGETYMDLTESSERDLFVQGKCDELFLDFAQKLSWVDDLLKYKSEMCEGSARLLESHGKQISEKPEEKF